MGKTMLNKKDDKKLPEYNFKLWRQEWNNFLGGYGWKYKREWKKSKDHPGYEKDVYLRYGIYRKRHKDGTKEEAIYVDGPGSDDRIEYWFFPKRGKYGVKRVVYLNSIMDSKEYFFRIRKSKPKGGGKFGKTKT